MNNLVDVRGVYRTESLFKETIRPIVAESYDPVYTIKEKDNEYPSMYRIYMESVDEYDAAMKLVGSMAHWEKLCALKWFKTGRTEVGFRGLDAWREDMRQRDLSYAKAKLKKAADNGDITATRKLHDIASKKTPRKVGRPEKEVSEVKDDYDYSADIIRLGLKDY